MYIQEISKTRLGGESKGIKKREEVSTLKLVNVTPVDCDMVRVYIM